DVTNATSAYLLFIKNLGKNGKAGTAIILAKTLLTKASLAHQVHTKTAALKIIVDLQGVNSVPFLIRASRDQDFDYRWAAVRFSAPYLNTATTTLWVKELTYAYAHETDVTIINMLGDNKVQAAFPALLKLSKTSNHEWTSLACISALGKIGQDKSIDRLLDIMYSVNSPDDQFGLAVKNALLTMKGSTVTDKVAKALPNMPASAQVILIDVLGARMAHDKIDIVLPLLNSADPSVRAAAYASLKQLGGEDNLTQLFALLSASTQVTETNDVQSAIIAVYKRMKNKSGQSTLVLQQMDNAPADRKALYFNILASVGDKQALKATSKAFDQGDAPTKDAVVTALSQWIDVSAAPELFRISKETTDAGLKNKALRGYVAMISKSDYTADEKIIYLRDAMEVAQTVPQKRLILQESANNKTFPALVFIARYMDDPQLQEEAANDVANIGLSDKNFYGNDIKQWLNKTLQIKKGGDSDYEKVAIRKFIAEMPAGDGLVPLFNNKDLTGWKGLVENPIKRSKMSPDSLAIAQKKADEIMRKGWYVKDSVLNFSGDGENICTIKQYRNFEMYVDWKIEKQGDAGIYLRGSPQVQIWDTSRVDVGAQVGSGGLYNNQAHQSKPLKLADNAINDWNNFHIIMKDDKVTVYLNGVLVVDNVVMDNYWDRKQPIFPKEQIELQAHGTHVYYRDIYIRELPE
ncbi:MAG: family 16 glycoside hydrolase, partial [Mucilaginibacter sp.]